MSTSFQIVSLAPSTVQLVVTPAVKGFITASIGKILEPLLGAAVKGKVEIWGFKIGSFGIVSIVVAVGSYLLEMFMPDEGSYANERDYQNFAQQMIKDGAYIALYETAVLTFLMGWEHLGLLNILVSGVAGQVLGDAAMGIGQQYLLAPTYV
jgi:hypothetical protein